LTGDYAGRHFLHCIGKLGVDRTFAINGVAEGVDHATFQLRANRYFENALGAAAGLAFRELVVITKDDCTNRIPFEVECHAVKATFELDHFAIHHVGQTVDSHDTVGHADDGALILGLRLDVQLLDALFDDVADFGWIQLLDAGVLNLFLDSFQ